MCLYPNKCTQIKYTYLGEQFDRLFIEVKVAIVFSFIAKF